jgi:formylglycine-generating enzyme required for sulfatase activity
MGEQSDQHRERIAHGFAIATKEVTVQQFQSFLKESPGIEVESSEPFSPDPGCPMNSVTWYAAAAYCNWLSKKEGIPQDQWCYGPNETGGYADGMKMVSNAATRQGYRLPTGAEWEYSCRAGAATKYFFGEPWVLLEKYAWYAGADSTQPVGRLKPNDLGLFDVHGNVWEWCQETDAGEPKKQELGPNEKISIYTSVTDQDRRLLRGGTFYVLPPEVRAAVREWLAPAARSKSVGFRLARTCD